MRPSRTCFRAALLTPAALALTVLLPLQANDQDRRVESTIKDSYNYRVYLTQDDIAVHADAGVVTLTGSVAQDSDRILAGDTAAGISGVRSVLNELKVRGEQPSDRSDAWITMKVKSALAFHKHVSAARTEVTTRAGVVTLTGQVDSSAQQELTTEYAKDVEGVKRVDNQQTVIGEPPHRTVGTRIDDASITALIKTSLLFHRSTHAVATRVSTRNGMVTLRGEARTATEKSLVGKLAEDTQGVKHVDNRMRIGAS